MGSNDVRRKRPGVLLGVFALVAAKRREPRQRVEIAAHAEAAKAGKTPGAIEDRQAGKFDRQAAAAVDWPAQGDAAPRALGRERVHDPLVRIKPQRAGDRLPLLAE